jgi:predicted nucleic acid-binding protein
VLDPGVLVSGAISSRAAPREILIAWHAGSFEMIVSPKLLY